MTKRIIKITAACVLCVGFLCLMMHGYFAMRGHGGADITTVTFEESGKRLKNPNRGFYFLHGYYIHDKMTDYRGQIAEDYCTDTETTLTLVEINLSEFKEGPISEQGLRNVENLFTALCSLDKQLIVRFLYDWDGENEENEPATIEIILGHMEQLSPVINTYADRIFILQGLFIGNWGEMNGTKYANQKDISLLADTLATLTDQKIYLAVRMPMHWRMATNCGDASMLASRLSLFNDGMLGSASDYGTYGETSKTVVGDYSYWNREEELSFQNDLCKTVPNGGEVIYPNPYNDFENAISDLSKMHVTYLNQGYDVSVYDKWNNTVVSEAGPFDGQTGKLYIENHLGYRLIIEDNCLKYRYFDDTVSVSVSFRNVGYAPFYREPEVSFVLVNTKTGERTIKSVDTDLCGLSGGENSGDTLSVDVDFSMTGKQSGTYEIYFYMEDGASKMPISLGVSQELTDNGYLLGTIKLKDKLF